MAVPNANWENAVTHTFVNYRPILADNLSNSIPLLAQMRAKGFIEELEGGRSIVMPLLYAPHTGIKSYSYYDVLSTAPQKPATAAEYLWKHLAGPITISGQEEWENQGKAKLKAILSSLMTQLDIGMRETLDEQLVGDGTGNGGKDITGLALYVEEGSAWSTIGGIDSSVASNSFWRNQFIDFNASYTSFGTATANGSVEGLAAMRAMHTACTRGPNKPSLIYTHSDLYNAYEAYGEGSHLRVNTPAKADQKLLDLGFDNVMFKHIPMVWGSNCPAQTMWFLNDEYLKLFIGKGRNFKMTPFQTSKDQEARNAHMILYANMGCSNRARQGVITDFVASP